MMAKGFKPLTFMSKVLLSSMRVGYPPFLGFTSADAF